MSTQMFLLHWKYLFLLVEIKHERTKNESLYFHDCRATRLKNAFACGKPHPFKNLQKEYFRRHAEPSDHAKHGPLAIATIKTAVSMFKAPKFHTSEAQTVGLLANIHF